MSNLPKQVQQQLEDAQRYDEALTAPPPDETSEPSPPEANDPPDPSPEPPPAPPPSPPGDDAEVWRQRYQTLQGMYNSQVPQLNQQVAELTAKVAAMEANKPAAKPDEPAGNLVTEKDVETFGSDLIDVVKRQAQQEVRLAQANAAKEVSRLEGVIAEMRSQMEGVQNTQATSSRQQYFADLAREVPDFAEVNQSPEFLAWLGEIDPLFGMPRQAAIDHAWNQYDVTRTAALFKAFKGLTAQAEPAPPNRQQQLEKQLTPGSSKNSQPPAVSDADRKFSMREIEEFYRDVSKGLYVGRDQERAKLEDQIDAAVAAGRLTP